MTIEDLLRDALADHAEAVPAPPDRWSEVETRAVATRRAQVRRRTQRRTGGMALVGLAAAVTAWMALPALRSGSSRRVSTKPAGGAPVATSLSPTTSVSSIPVAGSTPATAPRAKSSPSTARPSTRPPATFGYLPLYPFRSGHDASNWQASYAAGGAQPWHLDPGQTALSFAGFLGYSNVNQVIATHLDTSGAHVNVGFLNPNGQPVISAVVHLVRYGSGATAPWEVVGTDDTSFSTTTPSYGSIATSRVTVGGRITGVDENIKVQMLQLSSASPLGQFCCLPAGGSASPWQVSLSYQGATDAVATIAASTGGHLAPVERFTVTGVRTSSAPPPAGP